MVNRLSSLALLVISMLAFSANASAQVSNPSHPMEGEWKVVENQLGEGESYLEVDSSGDYTLYDQKGGTVLDTGSLTGSFGTYTYTSSTGSANGIINHDSG